MPGHVLDLPEDIRARAVDMFFETPDEHTARIAKGDGA
jgi:hypothetical protein